MPKYTGLEVCPKCGATAPAIVSGQGTLTINGGGNKLDYYGRELEVWALANDVNKLQATAREMRQTWDALRPAVEAKSATEAKKFDALVAQVETAKTPAAYIRVATPVLDEVDNLEKLFP